MLGYQIQHNNQYPRLFNSDIIKEFLSDNKVIFMNWFLFDDGKDCHCESKDQEICQLKTRLMNLNESLSEKSATMEQKHSEK